MNKGFAERFSQLRRLFQHGEWELYQLYVAAAGPCVLLSSVPFQILSGAFP